jgi:hypothetical protein
MSRTTIRSASSNGRGNVFPRFSARRKIPAQAVGLKKYRWATGPVSSIEDSEHAAAPLRHSEPLRVQHAPFDKSVCTDRHAFRSPAICRRNEFGSCHCTSHDSKVSTGVAAECSGHVFPNKPPCAAMFSCRMENPQLFVEQAGTRASQSGALARNAQVLAGRAADDDINRPERGNLRICCFRDAAKVRHVRQAVSQ